ncbi:hen egg protein precursor [Alligator mississippiensis]|uniref:Hen egg protein n=1 Tax=Alligator mississippiensis TaxID=8496 RepID=A0A151MYF2_ALLMI|nr:hen egg protein precursor [Alligator mississippiensis]
MVLKKGIYKGNEKPREVEALQCNICKRKVAILGCVLGQNKTTCEQREKCAIIKSSFGNLYLFDELSCTSELNCGKMRAADSESYLTFEYTCCETDFCN